MIKFLSSNRIAVLFLVVFVASSCNALRNMGEDHYSIIPNPLEVHGDKVDVNIKGKFPPKFFEKSVAIEVTPVLINDKKVESPFTSVSYQGEEYPGSFKEIPFETGSEVSYKSSIDYDPEMNESFLYAKITGREGDDEKIFEPIKLAPGLITTSLLVEDDFIPILAKDNYKRVTFESKDAVINFKVNSDYIRKKELKDNDYTELIKFLNKSKSDDKVTITKVSVIGFASPEGEESFNEGLSERRAKSVNKVLEAKKITSSFDGRGPDWKGLDKILQEETMQDKEVIIRSLDETPLLKTKEKTLRSLANTYKVLKNKILPALRRSKVVVEYELIGKSDEELIELVQNNLEKLDPEEILFALTLLPDNSNYISEKIKIYNNAAQLYADDYRFYNNAGIYYYLTNKVESAAQSFKKALEIRANETTRNNLYVAEYKLANGNKDKLKSIENLLDNVTQFQPKYNKGILEIKKGKYKEATELMAGANTFNSALVRVLNGDYNGAISVLNNIPDDKYYPKCDYLKAIAFARLGKLEDAKSHIEKAGKEDSSLLDKAKKDLEFMKIYQSKEEGKEV